MGPINDSQGLEQGGVNSSEFYKIYNNEQLTIPQETDFQSDSFGIKISDIHVASIGQADDTALVSHELHKLKFLLLLTEQYCKKYHVELSSSKTKLLFIPRLVLLLIKNTSVTSTTSLLTVFQST